MPASTRPVPARPRSLQPDFAFAAAVLLLGIAATFGVVVGPPKPRYRRPEELRFIPPLPQGFALQFDTDGETYTFSIKDTADACHFAIFSDQEKFVYTGTPLTGPRVVPVGTR